MVQEINAVAKPALVVNIETMPVMKFSNEQRAPPCYKGLFNGLKLLFLIPQSYFPNQAATSIYSEVLGLVSLSLF